MMCSHSDSTGLHSDSWSPSILHPILKCPVSFQCSFSVNGITVRQARVKLWSRLCGIVLPQCPQDAVSPWPVNSTPRELARHLHSLAQVPIVNTRRAVASRAPPQTASCISQPILCTANSVICCKSELHPLTQPGQGAQLSVPQFPLCTVEMLTVLSQGADLRIKTGGVCAS